MLRFDERVHLPKNRENTITFLVNGEPIGTVETLAPGAKTVDIPIPPVDYDSVTDALGYVPYDSSNPDGYITSSALTNYVTTNTNQTITAGKLFHNAELITDNFITLNGTTAYLRGQSGINYYNLMNLNSSGITVGSANQPIKLAGSGTRPQYNSNDLALYSDIPIATEEVFIAEYGTTTYQQVLDAYNAGKVVYAKRQVTSGTSEIFSLCGKQLTMFWFANPGGFNSRAMFISPQTTVYTLDAQDTWDIGTFTNASNTLSNVVAIDASSAVQTALDDKVSKAGDTMSGALAIETTGLAGDATQDNCRIYLKNSLMDISTTPSENLVSSLTFVDKNGNEVGACYNRQRTNGAVDTRLAVYRNGAEAKLAVGLDANDNAYCTFPDSICVDGQWVFKSTELASGVTWNASSHSNAKDYSLSNYLPNDGRKYEVLIRATGTTTTTSGKFIRVGISSDIITTSAYTCACRTRTSSTQNCAGTIILPVGSGRKITVAGTTDTSSDGVYSIRALGYRRIGLNS